MPNFSSRARSTLLAGLSALCLQCGAADDATPAPASTDVNPLGRARCRPPLGAPASPQDIEQAVQLLNALPKPTGVACFLESLPRPLTIAITNSQFSAQPALSNDSPRVFVKLQQLWVSVVIDGESSYLVEFGHVLEGEPPRSIKGELLLPIAEAVQPSAPYERVRYNTGTGCGLCHYDERREEGMAFAEVFSSIAFQPRVSSRVGVDELRAQHMACNWSLQPHRCEMLSAIFGEGDVVESWFPATMPVFF